MWGWTELVPRPGAIIFFTWSTWGDAKYGKLDGILIKKKVKNA